MEPKIFKIYPSLIDTCLNVIFNPNEAYSVIISALNLLSKIIQISKNFFDIDDEEENKQLNQEFICKKLSERG